MGISGEVALAAAKKYTDASLEGGGAIQGKNCTISSITPITGGNRVTFAWELDDGTEETETMDVMDGLGGEVRHKYNVQEHGIVVNSSSAASDNVTALQNLIDNVPEGSIIYFPAGRYDFNDGVTIDKRLGFLGEDTNFKTATSAASDIMPRSQIVLAKDFPANTTMFTREVEGAVAFKHLSIMCDTYSNESTGETNPFYRQPVNSATYTSYPYPYYDVPEHFGIDGVNGIDASLGAMLEISDCYFKGFTGYALKIGQHRFIDNCGFDSCNTCIEIIHTDSWISNCWFRNSYTAIHTSELTYTLLNVSDCWADQMAGHFIHCANPKDGSSAARVVLLVDNAWCDMIDQSAIYLETTCYLVESRISGRFSRIGMTYAGLQNSEWTKDKSPLADVIFAARYDQCEINVSVPRRSMRKVSGVEQKCPCKVIGLYNSGTWIHNSRFICPESAYENVVPTGSLGNHTVNPPVTGYNMDDSFIFCNDGIFRPVGNFVYKLPPLYVRSGSPVSASALAERANEFSLDSTNGNLYRSTGSGNSTGWELTSIGATNLKSIVAASSDFADFQTRIAAL